MYGKTSDAWVFMSRSKCFSILKIAMLSAIMSGVASAEGGTNRFFTEVHPFSGDINKKKNIFVFLDGTANNPSSATNVWQLYQYIMKNNDPQATALYIEGVGGANDAPLTEAVLGRGMEQRILEGYEFVSKNFAPDDNVYIFGFSRGAHQARSLAGMISYAGVPVEQNDVNVQRKFTYNDVIELVKKKSDEDYREAWLSWSPGQAPPMESEINKKLGIGVKPVSIVFLGVWDTVPGSSLKKYGFCKEKRGFIKRGSVFIPGIDKGERYKTDSYPPIRHIAHAVSLDEKRSKFRPLLVCPAIKDAETEIHEVWFPGAHADVGGGYADSDELSRISLLWMAKLLAKHYPIELSLGNEGNALGLAHWSIGDRPANIGSTCEDRLPYSGARIHPSAEERKKASTVRIRLCDEEMGLPYPMTCEQALKVSQQAVSTSGTCSETACCNK